jgi:hypothetical protein
MDEHRRRLDASVGASGPHGFAVRAQRPSSSDMPRPSHPALHVDDVRNAPLIERGMARVLDLICPTAQAEYFSRGDWTTQITLKSRAKLDFTRRGFCA